MEDPSSSQLGRTMASVSVIIGVVGALFKVGLRFWNKKVRKNAKDIIAGIGRLDNDSMRRLLKRVQKQ